MGKRMTEEKYKEYRKMFVGLTDEEELSIIAPHKKGDREYRIEHLRKMKNFERKHGNPEYWLHKYDDYLSSPYKAFVLLDEYSKEGFLWDRL